MSAIIGRYKPATKQIGDIASGTIHRNINREDLALCLRRIHKDYGVVEAREFRNYLLWLGTYPINLVRICQRNNPKLWERK